jgi:hypothetical protein
MKLTKKNSPSLLHPYLDPINSLYQIYVRTMQIKKNRDNLHSGWLVLAWVYVSYAYIRDIWFNMTTASQMFKDPFEWNRLTFTARLKGYRKGKGEKAAIAAFLCDHWLDQEDPSGDHC